MGGGKRNTPESLHPNRRLGARENLMENWIFQVNLRETRGITSTYEEKGACRCRPEEVEEKIHSRQAQEPPSAV